MSTMPSSVSIDRDAGLDLSSVVGQAEVRHGLGEFRDGGLVLDGGLHAVDPEFHCHRASRYPGADQCRAEHPRQGRA
jgi:hypothetical protein